MKRKEDSLRELWDNIKCINIRIIGMLEGQERKRGREKDQWLSWVEVEIYGQNKGFLGQ